ncbi:MAG: hypothetical protein PHY45_11685 [Rhodocyclaceae bacterium]|nr:hypothetical protein [Rhodocyclaceae bacterium]
MPRYLRNSAVLAKIETVYGTDAVPAGATDALLISNVTINPLNAKMIERNLTRSFLGTSDKLIGPVSVELSFDVEVAGSGTAGTAPSWGKLLRGCAMAETVTAGQRVEYNPISSAFESLTLYYYDDGLVHKLLGARGTFAVKFPIGDRPVFNFKFTGIDGGPTAVANPSLTLTSWKPPVAVTFGNTSSLLLGCTYATGAFTGGISYPSQGLEFDLSGTVNYTELVGSQVVDFSDRNPNAKIVLDLTAAQEVTLLGTVKSLTQQGMGLIQGSTAGNKVLFFAPAAQLFNPSKQEINGRRLIGFDVDCAPSAGNDEIRIASF